MSRRMRNVARRQFLISSAVFFGSTLLMACGAETTPAQSNNANSNTGNTGAAPAGTGEPTGTPDPDESPKPTPDLRPTKTLAPGEVRLEIDTDADASVFKYAQATLEAPANTKITLTLHNKTSAKAEVGHNWVLVNMGMEESVLANGLKAGDAKDWLNVKDPGIIAHTKLIEGDDSDAVTFKAPAPGSYTYLCTFPEHHAGGEKGTLIIK